MLGWAGPGDASQSERSSSHLMRGRDTDMCGGWREHVRQMTGPMILEKMF